MLFKICRINQTQSRNKTLRNTAAKPLRMRDFVAVIYAFVVVP